MRREDSLSLYGRFRAKRDKTAQRSFFPAPFFSGSHNTPYIQLIQYGRRIDKKVYLRALCLGGNCYEGLHTFGNTTNIAG